MPGDVQPVVVPVRVDLDHASAQTAAQVLGDQVRRARDAGAALPASAAGTPDVVSVKSLQQEYQHLQGLLQGVNVEFERLVKVTASLGDTLAKGPDGGAAVRPAGGGIDVTTMPATTPGSAGGDGGSGGRRASAGGGGMGDGPQGLLMEIIAGAGIATAAGLGIRRLFAEFTQMASLSRSLEESSFLAMIAGGQSGAVTQRTIDDLLAGPGFKTLTRPTAGTDIMLQLRQMGAKPTALDAQLLADMGVAVGGSPHAGGAFATELYRNTGSERALAIMESLRAYSRETGLGLRELVEQFGSLTHYFAVLHGTRRLTPADERAQNEATEYFNALPGGIGRGERAVTLQGNVLNASQHGMGKWMAVQAFREETGKDPFTSFQGMHEFRLWQRSGRLVPAMERVSGQWGGGDPYATAFFREEAAGFTPEQAEELRTGDPARRAQHLREMTMEQARAQARARAGTYDDDVGARSFSATAAEERGRSHQTPLNAIQKWFQELRGEYPISTTVGATAINTLGTGALLAGASAAYRRWGRRVAPTAAQAGAVTARAAMQGGRIWQRGAGLLGAIPFASDVLEAGKSPGDDWKRLIPGAAGALAGAILTGGNPAGALFGYGIGASARDLVFPPEVGGRATATMSASAVADGWRRSEVEEHLAILRGLRGRDGSTIPGAASEDGPELPASFIAPPSVRAWRSGRWQRGRLRPDDPRIAASARRQGLPLELMLGVIEQESKFHADALGASGEIGPMQLMPETARRLGVDPRDVGENLEGGARLLRQELDAFGGNLPRALVAYNRGRRKAMAPGAVQASDYDDKVLMRAERWRDQMRQLNEQVTDATSTETREDRAARQKREIEERELGPADEAGASRELVIRLEPGPNFSGIIEPSRSTIPGVHRRK